MGIQDWMAPDRRRTRATSFGPAADLYDQVRPGYPREALKWALEPIGPGPWRVADIGAGTGIMTRLIAAEGHDVVAVEPDPEMRRRLAQTTPEVSVLAGTAESLPFRDGDLAAAVAAQAYHWFDRETAHAELARVIRPGGVFAAIWNDRDESAEWVGAYSRIIEGDRGPDGSGVDSGRAEILSFGDRFGLVETATFRHHVGQNPDSLVMLLQSRSYYLTASAERRAKLEADVRGLAQSHPDLAGRSEFDLPYVTIVHRSVRL
jgi:SAM-dependent methyltransferase